MPTSVTSPVLIGRREELATLVGAFDGATGGRFAAVFLAGESGVGKSRLLEEFARAAEERGACVLLGECIMLAEGELPYGPIRAALRRLGDELETLAEPDREELARLFPQLGVPGALAPGLSAIGERLGRAHLFEVLLALLCRLGERAPVVLAIEDVHWADASTLDFLAFLIANARRGRVALVCTYRTDELHPQHPLRPFLARHERRSAVRRVELQRFALGELEAQVASIMGAAPERALVRGLYERTEGNAFFTEELLAASETALELPASLRDALMLRVDSLLPDAQHVLRLAATHGRIVPHRLLAAAADLPEPDLHMALREAVAHHVLMRRDLDTFAFRHALLAEALASDLLPGEQASFHLALAQALACDPTLVSRDGRAAAELCAHWLGAHRLPEALAAALRAAGEAEEVYAFAEASRHLARALELSDRVERPAEHIGTDLIELHARAAEAAAFADNGAAATRLIQTAIDRVDARADPKRAAVLRVRLGHYIWLFSGDDECAQRMYQEAVDLLPADEPCQELALALATLAQILMLWGCTAEALERCEATIRIARQTGARPAEALALNALGATLGFLGDRTTGIAHLRESLRMSEEIGDIDLAARGYMNLGEMLDQDAQYDASVRLALDGAARLAEVGLRDSSLELKSEAAHRLFKLGRLDEAERLTETAIELPPSLARLSQCAARARIAIHRGRLAEGESLVRAAQDALPVAPATWLEPLASARVELELLRGRSEEARRVGENALVEGANEYVAFVARLHTLTARAGALLAERAGAAGDEQAARAATARVRKLAMALGERLAASGRGGSPPPEAVVYGSVCASEAARAEHRAVAADWSAIAGRWADLELPLEEAYARLREAECLVLDGERERAAETLSRGLAIAGACGAAWLAEQVAGLARRARLAPVSIDQAEEPVVVDAVERLGLTERELAVLELLAHGMTNRQIGEQLFMATKTASVHVSRILAKLDVSSRVEAATAAQRLGLVR